MLPLWTPQPSSVESSQIFQFKKVVEKEYSVHLPDYESFWSWSVQNIPLFWSLFISYSRLVFKKSGTAIWNRSEKFSETQWFPGYEINFAENLLRKFHSDLDKIAIHFQPEKNTIDLCDLTRQDVLNEVFTLQQFFIKSKVSKGDRIAGILPNSHKSILGMLATTSMGAIWTSASPDFGVKGILDRFSQIEPKILLVSDGYFFKGKIISCLDKWIEVLNSLPSVETVLVWNFTQANSTEHLKSIESWCKTNNRSFQNWSLLKPHSNDNTTLDKIQFTPISFQDPVYIMYSSGTTGLPKCIVQGAGVLVNHIKELMLHTDLREDESITYYTTCGWMMWNWVASSLFVGSRLCIYDGNPFYPDWKFLWEWIDREKIHVFGTSAKYLTVLSDERAQPGKEFQLTNLRCILSTGSPLPISTFQYVYDSIKKDLQLSSISGGTDLNGCFALGNPMIAVYAGELQSRGLAMAVSIFDEEGGRLLGEKGELVCEEPFPSMPLYFWNDPDGSKYQSAYFSKFNDIWCHGDFAELTNNNGVLIYGRSDATLNPGGVRIGTSDIYSIVETFPEISDSVIIGQDYLDDVRIVLFVKMNEKFSLDKNLIQIMKQKIRDEVSPRHVPHLILPVSDIPYTINGKKVELAVKNIVEGKEVKNLNALANPQCLEEFIQILKKSEEIA